MALLYYPVAVAGTYFIGRNILFKGTSYAIDLILNQNADPDINETHTVETISAMLKTYSHLDPTHPSYQSMVSVTQALVELQDAIDRAKLKLSVHEAGYLTRFRTFDARAENVHIEKKAKQLMSRLDIFTKLIQLHVPQDQQHQHDGDYKSYTCESYSITDQ